MMKMINRIAALQLPVLLLFITLDSAFSLANDVVNSEGKLTGYPCVRANPLTANIPVNDRWLKSAQLLAFCFEQYGTSENSSVASKQEKLCLAGNCRSCLSVCKMTMFANERDCWNQCGGTNYSDACKRGCSFYLKIHGVNSTALVNLSSSNVPSTPITPKINKTHYHYSEVIWNTSASSSLIIYVIFSRDHSPDNTIIGKFQPINMTMKSRINITATNICMYHSDAEHHLELKFAYDIAAVSSHGYNSSTLLSNSKKLIEKGFRRIDFITKVTVDNKGVLEVKDRTVRIIYKVDWNINPGLSKYISYAEVTDEVENCGHTATDYGKKVRQPTQTVNQSVSLPNLKLKMCNFTFKVTPYVSCLSGISKATSILYPGCHIFPNAPPECANQFTTPKPLPKIIATKNVTSYNCTTYQHPECPVDGSSNHCGCKNGKYNVTFNWNVPSIGNATFYSIECELFFIIYGGMFTFPTSIGKWSLNKSARSLKVGNLEFQKDYSFKVHLKKSASDDQLMWAVDGLDFNVKDVPIILSSTTPQSTVMTSSSVATTTTSPATTTAGPSSVLPSEQKHSNKDKVALTAGLIMAAITVVILCIVLAILYQRRKRHAKQAQFNDLGPVTFQADPPDHWELSLDNIVFGEALGEGAFGKVYCATVTGVMLQSPSISCESLDKYVKMGPTRPASFFGSSVIMKAAVKVLQDYSTAQHKSEFLEEINLMKDVGQHKNIVNMLGCVTRGPTLCLVVEYMPYGDLLHYLRGRRSKILGLPVYVNPSLLLSKYVPFEPTQQKSTECLVPPSPVTNGTVLTGANNGEASSNDNDDISPEDLLRISWQIASGMEYLAQKGFVHRDLAARNVLVGPHKLCKISDFGLTRFVYEEKVYMGRRSRKLPIKWMSLEAIIDQRFTTYSDVWSFGVLLFEIVTLGGTPYPTMTGQEVLRFLRAGNRMEKPENCSHEIFTVMKACWLSDPLHRPTFTDIKERFETLISEGTPYVEFDIDNSNPYYNVPSFISIEDSTEDSLSDDPDEDEADWEQRFRSLDHAVSASPGERYATGDGNKWLAAESMATGGEGCLSAGRGGIESVSSDTSTTPLADGLLRCKINMDNISDLSHHSPIMNGAVHAPRQYQWHNSENAPMNVQSVPSTPGADKAPFVVDHYINMDT